MIVDWCWKKGFGGGKGDIRTISPDGARVTVNIVENTTDVSIDV